MVLGTAALSQNKTKHSCDIAGAAMTEAAMLQVLAPARQQAQPPTQSTARKLKKAPKQINGPDKQLVERKRKADATVDDLAASSLQGMSG